MWEVLLALIKEPQPTKVLLDEIRATPVEIEARDAQYYGNHLVTACRAMDGKQFPHVWQNLNGHGVACCPLCSLSICLRGSVFVFVSHALSACGAFLFISVCVCPSVSVTMIPHQLILRRHGPRQWFLHHREGVGNH